jgi:hypothetical protein
MIQTDYSRAVLAIANDIVRQMDDGHAATRTYTSWCADGVHRDSARIFYADLPHRWHNAIPSGVARVALDLDPTHAGRPDNECRIAFDAHGYDAGEAAADIARAVLDLVARADAYAT